MKKLKIILICILSFILGICFLSGCSDSTYSDPNTLTYDISDISEISISYDEENISLFNSDSEDLEIKEFMTDNNSKYYAKTNETDSSITISEGDKPLFNSSFSRYIEVYIPSSYSGDLILTSTNGSIDLSETDNQLSLLKIDCSSGTIKIDSIESKNIFLSSTSGTMILGNIKADSINIETTSADISCDYIEGSVNYSSTSGNIEIESASGNGNYSSSNSGKLKVSFSKVDGDLYFYNKNDDIELSIPDDLSFEFEAETKNGNISTFFQNELSINGSTYTGIIGKSASVMITLETKNGNINVEQ